MERTVRVSELLRSGRVRLAGLAGEHGKAEFEAWSYTTSTYVVAAREETFSFREMFSALLPLISENPQTLA